MFAYCGNNPISRVDESGEFWATLGIMAVGGVIGAITSAVSSVLIQNAVEGSVDVGSVIVAAATGFVSGAVSASPLGVVGQVIAGGAIGGLSYVADCHINGEEAKLDELLVSAGMGMFFARLGKNGANYKNKVSNLINSTNATLKREARRANQVFAMEAKEKALHNLHMTLTYTILDASISSTVTSITSEHVSAKYSSFGFFPNAPVIKPW